MPYSFQVVEKLFKLAPREYCGGCFKMQVGNKFYEVSQDARKVLTEQGNVTYCPTCNNLVNMVEEEFRKAGIDRITEG